MNCVDKIPLPNGLIMEVYDLSRQIAADTTKVELLIKIEIKPEESFFSNREQFDLTRKIFGDVVFYEHHMERTFVNSIEKDTVLNDLLASFKKDSLPYLSHTDFARRFCLSKYSDIVKNPYKYQRPS
ncbi:MAG: hypothetical protein JW943_13535 [Deltaproteobacteria bacterium]|nr:hypothetical protein [Deltaproteobacteria bacterium]